MNYYIPIFNIYGKNVKKFREFDKFNGNTIEGYINKSPNLTYGSMIITKINDKEVEWQNIYSSPKMGYPFNRKDEWTFPKYNEIYIYEKIDGTSINSYVYRDGDGSEYLTFKTRLRPILGESKFGNFYKLWTEILDIYPEINDLCFNDKFYSFEMYGKKNKILLIYPEMLDTKLLFVRDRSGNIELPDKYNFSHPALLKIIKDNKTDDELRKIYSQFRSYLEEKIVYDEDKKEYKGMEGAVWYFTDENGYAHQVKCKGKTISDIHMQSPVIPWHSIHTTVINAFEDYDRPSIDYIKQLLSEEFTDEKIEKSLPRIERILAKVIFEKKLEADVLKEYAELQKKGYDIHKDKGSVMRYFAKHYDKRICGMIFRFLW